jgi:hypothetical protein
MKSFNCLVLLSFLCFTPACQKDAQPKQTQCTGDCLFTIQGGQGTIVKMTCFDRFGILTDDPNTPALDTIYGIPDEMNASYEVVGKPVQFSGAFRANTLTPTFPDPSIGPGSLYQVDLEEINEQN